MPGDAGERGKPGSGCPVFVIRNAVERRKGGQGGFFLVSRVFLILEVFGSAEEGTGEGCGAVPRIGGRRDVFVGVVAGERRVEGWRKDRQQREQHQEDLRKAVMEAGLTQDEPRSTRRFQHFSTFGKGFRHVKRPAVPRLPLAAVGRFSKAVMMGVIAGSCFHHKD